VGRGDVRRRLDPVEAGPARVDNVIASFRNGLVWAAFGLALILATAPVWRLWVFGFNPTLDEMLQIICSGQ
jgi:hypothetical protein